MPNSPYFPLSQPPFMLPTCSLPQNLAPSRPLAPHNYPVNSAYPPNCQPPRINFLPNLGFCPTNLTPFMPTFSGPLHVVVSLTVHIRRLTSRPFKAPILFRPRRLLLRIVPRLTSQMFHAMFNLPMFHVRSCLPSLYHLGKMRHLRKYPPRIRFLTFGSQIMTTSRHVPPMEDRPQSTLLKMPTSLL